jgi:hypothetical protein
MGLGSEIRKKPIPDPGVKKAPDPGSGSATLDERQGLEKSSPVLCWGYCGLQCFLHWSEDIRARNLALGDKSSK